MRRRSIAASLTILSAFFSIVSQSGAQPADRIRAAIDDTRTVPLPGNRHPLARMEHDMGAAAPETRLDHMILVLQSDAAQQQALAAMLGAQHDPGSPLYRQWLTPESFAERFGASPNDIGRIVSWLGGQGFSIDEIPAGGRAIVFSGTARQVQVTFHTAIDRYRVRGQTHLANASDPRIPEALAGVVAGVATLHNFPRKAMHSRLQAAPQYSAGGSYSYLAPADFAAIYDIAPLYASGINGAGQTLAIVARCDITMSDVQTFRQTFGLPTNNPTIVVNGTDPGITSVDELAEADLDVQWSGAVAPLATIEVVVSASTFSTDGADLSAQYIVSQNLAPVMSTSFGSCEANMSAAELTFYDNLWQQAAVQGITAVVAAGDSGAAGCDNGLEAQAAGGPAVNGLCSTPYNVCVGGTEFNEGGNPGQYWSAGNAANWSSALGYIPEVVWNESGSNGGSGLWAGGGGASAYYSKPAWQSGPGVPADGQRDVPDVSMTAAAHDAYLMFYEGNLVGIGGTSAATPSFAGLMTLVNQQTGVRQGNANTSLYALATLQGAGGLAYFNDITSGDNTVPGAAGFSAAQGYDQASGLGSVDAAVLVNHWNDASGGFPSLTLTVTPGSIAVVAGAASTVVAQVGVTNGFSASVALSTTGLPAGAIAVFASPTLAAPGSGGSALTITAASNAVPGTYPIQIVATGAAVTQTLPVLLTISAPVGCNLAAAPASLTLTSSSSAFTQISCGLVQAGFGASLKLAVTGAPLGVAVVLSPASITPGTARAKLTVMTAMYASAGNFTLTVTATGGGLSLSLPFPLTINPSPTFTMSLAPPSLTVLQGTPGQVTITTAHVGTFNSTVALSVTGAPIGVTASFSTASLAAPGDGASTLTIQAGPTVAAAGIYNITIKAVGGSQTKTLMLPVTIQLLPAFILRVAQSSLMVAQSLTTAVNVTISGLVGGFNSPVALSLAAANGGILPTGLNPSFAPAATVAPGSGTSILSFSPDGTSTPGTYFLTIAASGGGVTRTAALSLTVTPSPSFSLHPAAPALNLLMGGLLGGMANTQIVSAAVYGFSAAVALSTGALPAGVIATFAPPNIPGIGGKSTFNVQATSLAAPGSYPITVSGSGGGVTSTVIITVNIGQLTVTPQSAVMALGHGGTASVLVTTSVVGSYNSFVTLWASGLPRGVTAQFSPGTINNPAAGASILKLTAISTAILGTQTITVNAMADGQTSSATISLTVQ